MQEQSKTEIRYAPMSLSLSCSLLVVLLATKLVINILMSLEIAYDRVMVNLPTRSVSTGLLRGSKQSLNAAVVGQEVLYKPETP